LISDSKTLALLSKHLSNMKKILFALAFICSATYASAQYTYSETGPNGNVTVQGQYNADPGIQLGDSKQTIATKQAAVHKVGVWKYWHENGTMIAEEHYDLSGNRVAIWKTWSETGTVISELNFTTGHAVYYYDNGTKAEEGSIRNDMQRVGEWKGWHSNGTLNYVGEFDANGNKKGLWKFYDAQGNSIGTENH
jgi:hypothetical protein